MRASLAMRRAMASSTSSPADGSPRQLTDSSMALCDTVPRAVWADQANSSASWARKSPSHPCTELSRCFETHSVSLSGSRAGDGGQPLLQLGRGARRAAAGRTRAARGAGRRGPPAPRPAPGWARCRVPRRPPPNDVTPPGLNGSSARLVHPPLRPSRPDPRRAPPAPSASSSRASAAHRGSSACCGRSSGGTAAPPSRWSCGAARGPRCRPTSSRAWWPPTASCRPTPTAPAPSCGSPSRDRPPRRRPPPERYRCRDAVLATPAPRRGDQRDRRRGQLRRRVRGAPRRRRSSPAPTTGRPRSAPPTTSTSRPAPTSCAAARPTTCRSAATPCSASATASSTTSAATAT